MTSTPALFDMRFPSGLAGGDNQLTAAATGCVLFPLEPHPDESLSGFVLRTASWNQLRSASLLRTAGVTWGESLSTSVAPRRQEVARRLGISEAELQRCLYADGVSRKSMVTYFGTRIERSRLNLSSRRVSPASLRVSPHHRALWEIEAINFCPESWEFLIDQCPRCLASQTWRHAHALDLCGRCGADLKQVGVTKVEPAYREMLELAAGLVHPLEARRKSARAALPAIFHAFPEAAIFELVLGFSRTLHKHALDPWLRSDLRPAARLAKAMELVFDFPKGLQAIVAQSRQDNTRRSKFFLQWAGGLSDSHHPELRAFVRQVARTFEKVPHGPSRLKVMREAKGKLTLREVAARLQLENSDVAKLVRSGVFGPAIERGDQRSLRWFDPAAVDRVSSRLKDRISALEFERTYGVPRAASEQFINLGLLHIATDLAVYELYPGLQFRRTTALDLIARIEKTLWHPRPNVPVFSLNDLFQGVGGSEKPWGAIIQAFLADRLPGGLAAVPGSRLKLGELIVHRGFANDFLAGRHPTLMAVPASTLGSRVRGNLSRTETEQYLNCFPRDVSWLVENQHLSISPRRPIQIRRSDVERLGARVISSREIFRRWRVSPAYRDALASKYGITRVLGPFWPRAAVTEHMTLRGIGSPWSSDQDFEP